MMILSSLLPSFDREICVMVGLGVCSMLVISTENTLQNMQKTVVSSIEDDRPGFKVEGYTISGIKFSLACVVLWFSPYVNYVLGPRLTMSIAAFGFLIHILSFITEIPWVIYAGAVVIGLAEAAFWPAEGRYLIENSSPSNLNRNMAVTVFVIKSAYVLGNLLVYFAFHGLKYVTRSSRNTALWSLSVLHTLGVLSFMFLPRSKVKVKGDIGAIETIKRSWRMLLSPQMLWMLLTFCYNGFQVTFWQGVYSPSIGFTLGFGNSVKELVGLSGVFMSVGGVIGCLLPLMLSKWIRSYHYARVVIVSVGALAQIMGFTISILIMPSDAVFGNTNNQGPFPPNLPLAMMGSTLLCFGDACLFIQTVSILGDMYRDHGGEAISLYRFGMNVTAAMSYFWSNHINLYVNACICIVTAVLNVLGFFMADRLYLASKSKEASLSDNGDGFRKQPTRNFQETVVARNISH